jgi:hypothetical protein
MKKLTLTIIATLLFAFVTNGQNNAKTNNGVNTFINTYTNLLMILKDVIV